MTDMMERLPTELMQEVMKYSDKRTIHSFTIVSKYCEIAQPLIFRRISTNQMAYERFPLFVEQMQNSNKLALMIKVLRMRPGRSDRGINRNMSNRISVGICLWILDMLGCEPYRMGA